MAIREISDPLYSRQVKVGDQVNKLKNVLSDAAKSFSKKLAAKFDGPYTVVNVLSPKVYILVQGIAKRKRLAKAHVSYLSEWIPPDRQKNMTN